MIIKQQDKSDKFKELITKGIEQGFLTLDEINDNFPADSVDPEQIKNIISKMNDMGVVVKRTPEDALPVAVSAAAIDEEAVAALASIDS
jgi:RNA polymerase primary sigma factor